MWRALTLILLAVTVAGSEGRQESDDYEGDEGDGRAIPGEAGRDYPTLAVVPATTFSCGSEGFFADAETRCQVFHICSVQKGVLSRQSFLCPNGTVFNANVNTCDWWNKVHCDGGLRHIVDDAQSLVVKETRKQNLKISGEKSPTGRRKQETRYKLYSSNKSANTDIGRSTTGSRGSGFLEVLNNNDYSDLNYYDKQPIANSISTESYQPSTTQNFRKVIGTKGTATFPDSSRVAEVTIKPRVRYTYNLKASTDNPLYSLNPLIHLARDSSLLSTFTGSSDPSIKVTRPVERYVVNGVLPQYSKGFKPAQEPSTPITDQPDTDYGDQTFKFGSDEKSNQGINTVYTQGNVNPLPLPEDVGMNGENFKIDNRPEEGFDQNGNKGGSSLTSTKPSNTVTDSNDNKNPFSVELNTLYSSPRDDKPKNNYPQLVRVTSGFKFSPSDDTVHNTPKTVKVTNSYSVEDNFSTEAPEVSKEGVNVFPSSIENIGDTLEPVIPQNEDCYVNQDNYNNGIKSGIDQYNLQTSNEGKIQQSGLGSYNSLSTFNETNVDFINRFIVNEPNPQYQNIDSYSTSSVYSSPGTNEPNPQYQNIDGYSTSSVYNSSGTMNGTNAEFINRFIVNEPSPQFHNTDGYSANSEYKSPGTINETNTEFINRFIVNEPRPQSQNIEGHSPNGFDTHTPSTPTYTYNPVSDYYLPPSSSTEGNLISGVSQSPFTVKDFTTARYDESNDFSTTPNPPKTSYNNIPGHYITLKPTQQQFHSRYISSTERTRVPTSSYYPSAGESISGGPRLTGQHPQNQHHYSAHYIGLSSGPLQNPGNENVLSTEKSVEIEGDKEKENIFSGLKIASVMPSVEAYSWSMVVTPSTTSKGRLTSQTNLPDYQNPSTTPFSPSLNSYNNQGSVEGGLEKLVSPAKPDTGSVSVPTTTNGPLFSSQPLHNENSTSIPYPRVHHTSIDSGKTTATYLSNNKEVNLYSVPNPSQETHFNSQRLYNGFPTEPSFFLQSTSPHVSNPQTTFRAQNEYDGPSPEGISSFAFSTPKPFTEGVGSYIAPLLHSTILPDYREEGKPLLKPADLLRINSLHSLSEARRDVVESAELIKSISFSFDNADELEQFRIANSKGLL